MESKSFSSSGLEKAVFPSVSALAPAESQVGIAPRACFLVLGSIPLVCVSAVVCYSVSVV